MTLSDRNGPLDTETSRPALARAGRTTFTIGSITFIAIGALHTLTQLTTLSDPIVQTAYRAGGPIDVNGQTVDGWELFAGVSVLMGLYAMTIGATDLIGLRSTGRADRLPPPALSVINVVTLAVIAVVGATLLGPLQLVGGLVGIALFGLPAIAALRSTV